MKTIPSRVFLWWVGAGTLAALGVLVFPAAWLPLVAFDLGLALVALVDLLVTPRPAALEATRLVAERMSALNPQPVTVRVSNRSRVFLSVRVRDTIPESFGTSVE